MKLLWITHRSSKELSVKSRVGISNSLNHRGWNVHFMSPDGDFQVERSKKFGLGHRSFTRSLSSTLKSIDLQSFSVAIVEWTAVEGAINELKESELPWIILDRSPPVTSGIIGWVQRKQYERAWSIANKQSSGRAVKSEYMASKRDWNGPSSIVPAGVDVDEFKLANMNENPLVVCHGSMDRSRELNRLASMNLNLLLFGEGNDSQRLSKMTRVEGVGDVASRLATADVGVLHLPNREVWRHASPLKVAEYAAAGLPVVASEVSGLERYRNAEWIRLIPLGDDHACKVAINTFCKLPLEKRRELGVLARQEAENSMTWAHCTESLHEMLLEVKR